MPASRSAVGKSQDRSLIFIATGDNSSTEVRFVPADDPDAPSPSWSRRGGRRCTYSVDCRAREAVDPRQ